MTGRAVTQRGKENIDGNADTHKELFFQLLHILKCSITL